MVCRVVRLLQCLTRVKSSKGKQAWLISAAKGEQTNGEERKSPLLVADRIEVINFTLMTKMAHTAVGEIIGNGTGMGDNGQKKHPNALRGACTRNVQLNKKDRKRSRKQGGVETIELYGWARAKIAGGKGPSRGRGQLPKPRPLCD